MPTLLLYALTRNLAVVGGEKSRGEKAMFLTSGEVLQ